MSSQNQEIAIVGMAGLFPGAPDIDVYWENILSKRCFIADGPEDWVGQMFDPDSPDIERIYTKKVGLLGDLAVFDPVEFGVVPNSLDASEPDHFLALKFAAAALHDAGYSAKSFNHEKTGVILGRGATPNRATTNAVQFGVGVDQTMTLIERLLPELKPSTLKRIRKELRGCLAPLVPEAGPGLVSNVAVGRIANRLDLQGPSFMVDAACASSLIAVELAMKELCSGRSEMMLAGGVQGSMPALVYMLFTQIGALTRTSVFPFSSNAEGTALSEGAGFLVLKRLSDAVNAGDRIYAVLKAIGVASDGRAQGMLTPRVEGEILAMQRAYEQCDVSPKTIGLIEAHGTGIPLGDRIEIDALRKTFGSSDRLSCAVGSVKSMIGHCIPAAGMAGLIKTALALHRKVLPPTICENVNPDLALQGSPLYINTEPRPWIHGSRDLPRRAAVDAFGFGGINAHAILQEYTGPDDDQAGLSHWATELAVFSGETVEELTAAVEKARDLIARQPAASLASLACTWSQPPQQACRLAIVASSKADLLSKLEGALKKIADTKQTHFQTRSGIYFGNGSGHNPGRTAFLFPGQGSQYPGMMGDLCIAFPSVRRHFDRSDAAFFGLWEHLPSDYIFPPPTGLSEDAKRQLAERAFSTEVATETVFTASMALYELLRSLGVKCDVMAGHSSGDYAAMVASGTLRMGSLDEEINLKRRLNSLSKEVNAASCIPTGSLLAVGAVDPAQMEAEIAQREGRVYLAMDNCRHQKILFGAPDEITALAEKLRDLGGICQVLPFNAAFHTPLSTPIRDVLLEYFKELPISTPDVRLFSCSTREAFPENPDAVREIAAGQWLTRVRFRETIERLHADGIRVFIEVGPSSHLTNFVQDTLPKGEFLALASNERTRPGIEQIQRLLGQLYCHGFDSLDFSPFYRGRGISPLLDLPETKRKLSLSKVLNVSIPFLKLSDQTIADTKRELSETNVSAPMPVLPALPDPSLAEVESPVETANAPAPGAQAAVLAAHQELMLDFLTIQQQSILDLFERFDRKKNGS
jgi:acyl transferase domain-containing protein